MSRSKRIWIVSGSIVLVLGITYLLGPRAEKPDFSSLRFRPANPDLNLLEDSIRRAESSLPLRPDNEARIIWAKPYARTRYCIVYLPGNGASQEEGDPIHEAIAHRYGCNLFLARPAEHGLVKEDPMLHIDAATWMQSALDAISVGRVIGDSVILMTCSTGSTLGLYVEASFPGLIAAHILLSPNIDMHDPRSSLLIRPWGLQLARLIMGSKYYGWESPPPATPYWYTRYRIEGLVTLKAMINAAMVPATFRQIHDPVFMAYYYKDAQHQDDVVSVPRMLEMYAQLGTPAALKREVALPDAGTHIIASDMFNTHLESLWIPLTAYCEQILKLAVADSTDWKPFLDPR